MILGAISCHLEPTEIYRHKAEGISLRLPFAVLGALGG